MTSRWPAQRWRQPGLEGCAPCRWHRRDRKNDGLDGAIQFRNGDLQGHLHRVQAKVALFPLLGGLETRKRHHVGTVELLQRLNRLGVV